MMRTCKYCQRECETGTALVQHERYCPSNPDKWAPYRNTGKPGKPGFQAVHLVINEPEHVQKYARIWEELGSMSHRDTIKTMLDIVLERLEKPTKQAKAPAGARAM